MRDTQDQRMKELVYRLIEMAPEAPLFPEEPMVQLQNGPVTARSNGRRILAFGAALAVVLVFGIAAATLLSDDDSAPPATQPTTSSTSPTTPDATTAEVEAFLQARVAGSGAEAFLAEDTEPQLMYATSTGAPYQWFDLVELTVPELEGSRVFRARLYADDGLTVVEQHLDVSTAFPGIWVRNDWFVPGEGRLLPGTTENGQPVGRPFRYLDGVVTFDADWRWSYSIMGNDFGHTLITLVLGDGQGQFILQGQFMLMAAPAMPVQPDCSADPSQPELYVGPAPEDAATLAEGLRTVGYLGPEWGLEVSDPLAVRIGGVDALQLDIVLSDEPGVCNAGGDPASAGEVLWGRADDSFEEGAANPDHLRLRRGDRMRLYLLDVQFVPGSILTIAVVGAEDRFEEVMAAATEIIESIQFPYGG